MEENKHEVYACNKYLLDFGKEEILLCNAPQYCDEETKARRKCRKVILTVETQRKIGD